jgi:hypothetical protein
MSARQLTLTLYYTVVGLAMLLMILIAHAWLMDDPPSRPANSTMLHHPTPDQTLSQWDRFLRDPPPKPLPKPTTIEGIRLVVGLLGVEFTNLGTSTYTDCQAAFFTGNRQWTAFLQKTLRPAMTERRHFDEFFSDGYSSSISLGYDTLRMQHQPLQLFCHDAEGDVLVNSYSVE